MTIEEIKALDGKVISGNFYKQIQREVDCKSFTKVERPKSYTKQTISHYKIGLSDGTDITVSIFYKIT